MSILREMELHLILLLKGQLQEMKIKRDTTNF